MNQTWVHRYQLSQSSGFLLSPEIASLPPFDNLVGSWNAEVPEGAELEMQAQVRLEGGWSKWFILGRSRADKFFSPQKQEDESGHVDIDTLKLKKKADAFRYRFSFKASKRPITLSLAAAALSDGASGVLAPFQKGPWVSEISVRPRSQMEEQEQYKHDICSPTTLSMAMDYWGQRRGTIITAEAVRDQATGMFGVWPANIAAAHARGLEGYVARLESLEDLQEEIARSRPVPVSVTFGEGELSGAPIKKTKGHLFLVTGFTEEGNVIVLDPAAPDRKSARRVYDRAEFHKAWRVNKRGLAYILGKPLSGPMAVGVPVADLMASPAKKKGLSLSDPDHLSQLLYGEKVTVLSARGDWVKVSADEQDNFLQEKKWRGYRGWLRSSDLASASPEQPDTVVRTKQALLHAKRAGSSGEEEIIALSVGTRLKRVSQAQGMTQVRLLDGRLAEITSDSLYVPSESNPDENRHQIIKTAELFLGTSYYWGGRSGVQQDLSIGVDCSGLSSLAYRIHGINIPRDSHEQKLKSRPIRSKDMKPGDLIFLTDSTRSSRITHVIIFTGGDGVIESRKSAGRTLRSSFTERFGVPLSEIESGDKVTDLSFPKPRRRVIYFGSYL